MFICFEQNAHDKTVQKLKATELKLEQQREKNHHLFRQVNIILSDTWLDLCCMNTLSKVRIACRFIQDTTGGPYLA